MDKAIYSLRGSIMRTTRAIDYIQPPAKDFDGLLAKLDLLELRRGLLLEVATAEACEHNCSCAMAMWEGRQKEIQEMNKRICAIYELLNVNPPTTQET